MKKFISIMMVGGILAIGALALNRPSNQDEVFLSNVEALSDAEGGGIGVVNCYCKTNWFSSNVCSANASGAYCGGDPCTNHDGNCR